MGWFVSSQAVVLMPIFFSFCDTSNRETARTRLRKGLWEQNTTFFTTKKQTVARGERQSLFLHGIPQSLFERHLFWQSQQTFSTPNCDLYSCFDQIYANAIWVWCSSTCVSQTNWARPSPTPTHWKTYVTNVYGANSKQLDWFIVIFKGIVDRRLDILNPCLVASIMLRKMKLPRVVFMDVQ